VSGVSYMDKATAANRPLPEWIAALAAELDKAGKVAPVAARVGYSASALSSVINGSYTGRLAHIQDAVERTLMRDRVKCPVLGTITGEKCERFQRRKTAPATNPVSVRLFKACHSGVCPYSKAAAVNEVAS